MPAKMLPDLFAFLSDVFTAIDQIVLSDGLTAAREVAVPSSWGDTNKTALAFAAEKGHIQMVQLLIQNGADPSIPDKQGRTRLEIAWFHEFPEVVAVLESP